jgi:putative ABC transport system permease protein
VVGVTADTKIRTLGEAPRAMVYHPYGQRYSAFLTVVTRTSGGADQTALAMLAVGRELDPDFFVWETKTMARHIGIQTLPARLSAFLLSVFPVLALLLSAIGLYGVVSYTVAQHTREVGIRLALGADYGAVVRMLTGSGVRLVVTGAVLGLVLSVLLSRLLSQLLFGIDAFDPLTFVAVPLVMVVTGLLAAWVPARRASRVNPVSALRSE